MTNIASSLRKKSYRAPSEAQSKGPTGSPKENVSRGLPLFLNQDTSSARDVSQPIRNATPLAYTDSRGTYMSPAAEASPNRQLIDAHESVHRGQFALGRKGIAPSGGGALEAEARLGAQTIATGRAFAPQHAAPSHARLNFDEKSPLANALNPYSTKEMQDIQTVQPGTDDVNARVEAAGGEDTKTRVADYHFNFSASAKGQRGSIVSETLLDIHYDPNDPKGWITPSTAELHIIQPPEFWKFYPVTISYRRTINYSDEYSRSLDVEVNGQALVDYPKWEVFLKQHPTPADWSLADLTQLDSDSVSVTAKLSGQGDLTAIVEHDYPSMPKNIKDQMLRGSPLIAYDASAGAGQLNGGTLRDMSTITAQNLIPKNVTIGTPAEFVHLELNAGLQYDAIRLYLATYDASIIPSLQKAIEEGLSNPDSGGPLKVADDSDGGFFSDILNWLGDLWDSLPTWLRGSLKAIGKAALFVGAIVGLAFVIVALAPVELTVAGVALAIGGVLLAAGFLHSIVQRSLESVATGTGNPLTVFLVAIADTVGISGVYEGITNESILSGQDLNLSEEEQYERGVGGALQFAMLVLGLRTAKGGRPTTTDIPTDKPPIDIPTREPPVAEPPGADPQVKTEPKSQESEPPVPAATREFPKSWDKFDPANNQSFKERLNEFRGNDDLNPDYSGGEGRVFTSEGKTTGLKRWFKSRLGDMPESLRKLQDVRSEVSSNPKLNETIDVVEIHEQKGDWILRDFDANSLELKNAAGEGPVTARTRAINELEALRSEGKLTAVLADLLKKLKKEPPSANLHWSPSKGKILVIDMQ